MADPVSELTYADYQLIQPGVMRQRELRPRRRYDGDYLAYYDAIDERVRALSQRRLDVLCSVARPSEACPMLDFGCGRGRFVEAARRGGYDACGYDVACRTELITERECLARTWRVVTFFDVLEHLVDPAEVLQRLNPHWVMLSIPECHRPEDADWFMAWKHRKPGEHLWHWSRHGLLSWFAQLGFQCRHVSNFEDDFRPRYDPRLPNILSAIFESSPGAPQTG